LELGASFVARQFFSGDKEQLIPLFKAAVSFQGFAGLSNVHFALA
jgi:hypothetical protein